MDPSACTIDKDLLELLLYRKKALTLRKACSLLYSHLCSYLKGSISTDTTGPSTVLFSRLMHCSEEEVVQCLSPSSKAEQVKTVAKELYDGGYILEAGALLVSAQSFHRELSTLNDSLAYTAKLFSK